MGRLITLVKDDGEDFSVDAENVEAIEPGPQEGTSRIHYVIGRETVRFEDVRGTVAEVTAAINAENGS